MIAQTPQPPYYAVIFTSVRTAEDNGYAAMDKEIEQLATQQPGYLGHEWAHTDIGITVSYWSSLEAISKWKDNVQHRLAQQMGRKLWYSHYKVRICKVERDYSFDTA